MASATIMRLQSYCAPDSGFRRFANAMVPTATALALQLIAFTLTARGLGAEMFGRYAALLAIAAVSIELVGLGGADTLVRSVARRPGDFSRCYGQMLALIGVSFPFVLAGAVAVALFGIGSDLSALYVVLALAAEIWLGRIFASLELTMVAHHDTFRASCIRLVNAASRALLAAAYFSFSSGLLGWIIITFVASILLSLAALSITTRLYGRPAVQIDRSGLRSGLGFACIQTARAGQVNMDRVILARFAEAAAMGSYAAASRLLQLGFFPLQVVTRILYPRYFIVGEAGIASSARFAVKSLPVLLATGVGSAVVIALAAYLAPLILGSSYADSTAVGMKLAIALPIIAIQYAGGDALAGAGHQSVRAAIAVISAVGFGFILVAGARFGGTDGVIAAFLIGQALLAALLWGAVGVLVKRARHR